MSKTHDTSHEFTAGAQARREVQLLQSEIGDRPDFLKKA